MHNVARRRMTGTVGLLLSVVVAGLAVLTAPAAQAASPVVVSLTFTDGLASQGKYGGPVLAAHGVGGTFYVSSNFASSTDKNYLRFYQLDDLYRAGNEIAGMGRDHKSLTATYSSDPAADLAYKQDQVCGDRQVLADLGYDPQSFAYPQAAEGSTAWGIVSGCGYRSARTVGGLSSAGPVYAESVPPANAMRVRSINPGAAPLTLTALQNHVNAAAAHGGGWLPIPFNQVCSQSDPAYSTCMATTRPIEDTVLSAFLDWIATQAAAGVTVATVRDVMGAPPAPVLPPRKTTVSITFDDGDASQYPTGAMLAAHGMAATYYQTTGQMQMTWNQVAELAAAGNDIGGHTLHHVDVTDPNSTTEQKRTEICEDRRNLQAHGYAAPSFAYPFGAYNDAMALVAKQCGYQTARRAGGINISVNTYSETIPPNNAYIVRTVFREATTALQLNDLTTPVEEARTHGGGWVPMVFHEICYPGSPGYQSCMNSFKPIESTTFVAFLDWLAQAPADVQVRTVADVMSSGNGSPLVTAEAPAHQGTTRLPRPTVSGQCAANGGDVSATIYAGALPAGSSVATVVSACSAGAWSGRPLADLVDGTYTVQARQVRAGVAGTSVPTTFTVDADKVAPTVVVDTPSAGTTSTSRVVTVAGTAGTAAGDAGSVSVEVYAGPQATGSPAATLDAPVGGNGRWSVDTGNLADGTYTVVARQSDEAGNSGSSSPVGFAVDASGPAVVITQPGAGVRLDVEAPAITGTAGTGAGDAGQVSVTVYAGVGTSGQVVESVGSVVAGDGSWSVQPALLGEGTYTAQATQGDSAGNTGTSNTVSFVIDRSAPSVSVSSPTAGASSTSSTPTVSGSAGTAAGDAATVTVELYAGPTADGAAAQSLTATVAGNGSWSVSPAALSDGTWTVQARQSDDLGHAGTSGAVTFTVDATGPSVSITSPSDGGVTRSPSLTASGTGGTAAGDSSTVTLELYAGPTVTGSPLRTLTAPVSGGTWTADLDNLVVGAYTLSAVQSDAVGHVSRSAAVHFQAASSMTVASVTPSGLGQGSSRVLTVVGSGFQSGASATVSGSGVTVTGTVVQSATLMAVSVSVATNASVGTRNLIVSLPGTFDAGCTGCLRVNAAPTASKATPASLGQGAVSQVVKITGTGFAAGATVNLGASVTAVVTSVSSTSISATVSVAEDATTGARSIVVTNADGGTATCVGCFTVVAGPKATGVSPSSLRRGTTTTISVTGTGFDSSVKVALSGSGLTLQSLSVKSATSLTVQVKVNKQATLGGRTMTLTSSTTKGVGTRSNAVTIVS
jgi:peptidoglycan/xylan/chitin deacetylase (PgdA/CDA1 family)